MLSEKDAVRLSKFISLVLRHKPEVIDLKLDKNGWASVDDLINKSRANEIRFTFEDLKQVVDTNDKMRFSFDPSMQKIRASQGHSINVDLNYTLQTPPKILYHGTSARSVDSILNKGIIRQNRLHVHLSQDAETAKKVGQRHGSPVVFEVMAGKMHEDNSAFFLSDNGVWLTNYVSPKYLRIKPMITPVVQKNPFTPECGDILSGQEYIAHEVKDKEDLGDLILTSSLSYNPWLALRRLGVDTVPLEDAFRYECPFTNNTYYHFIPVALVVKDLKSYRKPPLDDRHWDLLFDMEWTKHLNHHKLPEIKYISRTMLGHGYTEGTLPEDGFGDHNPVLIELSNGDFIYGFCWFWYNK